MHTHGGNSVLCSVSTLGRRRTLHSETRQRNSTDFEFLSTLKASPKKNCFEGLVSTISEARKLTQQFIDCIKTEASWPTPILVSVRHPNIKATYSMTAETEEDYEIMEHV